jgi:hypothetical protein
VVTWSLSAIDVALQFLVGYPTRPLRKDRTCVILLIPVLRNHGSQHFLDVPRQRYAELLLGNPINAAPHFDHLQKCVSMFFPCFEVSNDILILVN